MFAGCTSLTSITTIPTSVTNIGWGAFEGCTSLTSITINASWRISENVFNGWTSLQTINIHGPADQADADDMWGSEWRSGCNAKINYFPITDWRDNLPPYGNSNSASSNPIDGGSSSSNGNWISKNSNR